MSKLAACAAALGVSLSVLGADMASAAQAIRIGQPAVPQTTQAQPEQINHRWRHHGGGAGVYFNFGGAGIGFTAPGPYYPRYRPRHYAPRYYAPRHYNGPRYYRPAAGSHVRWCQNRYKSYRAWDNSFQPYHGPRQQCYSPYS